MNAVTNITATDAGRLDKHYETRCILEGQRRISMNIYEDDLQAFAALFNESRSAPESEIQPPSINVSYIQKWRQGVNGVVSVSAPKSPAFGSFSMSMSPVAIIHPDALNVTSAPPYTITPEEPLRRGGQPQIVTDLDLEELDELFADEDELTSEVCTTTEPSEDDASDSMVMEHVIYPASVKPTPLPTRKPDTTFNIAGRVKWLPAQLKYKIMSARKRHLDLFRR